MGKNKGIINFYEIRNRLNEIGVHTILEWYGIETYGKNKILCIFHNEKTPSFSIYNDGKNWTCFGECSTSGDCFDLVFKKEDENFTKAVQVASDITGIEAVVSKSTEIQFIESAMDELREKLNFRFNRMTWYHSNEGETTKLDDSLKGRCINIETARKYGVGHVGNTDVDGYEPFILKEGKKLGLVTESDGKINADKIVEAGLLNIKNGGTPEEYYEATLQDCITFPIYKDDKLVGFEGRRIDREVAEKYGKYNKVATKFFLFNSDVVYGYDDVHIFEGILDTLSAIQCEYPNSIGLLGVNNLGKEEKAVLSKVRGKIYLHLDDDNAGQKRAYELLEELGYKAHIVEPIGVGGEVKDLNGLFVSVFKNHCLSMSEEEAFKKAVDDVRKNLNKRTYGIEVESEDENAEPIFVGGAKNLVQLSLEEWASYSDTKRAEQLQNLLEVVYKQFNGQPALLDEFKKKMKEYGTKAKVFDDTIKTIKNEVTLTRSDSTTPFIDVEPWQIDQDILYVYNKDNGYMEVTRTVPNITAILNNVEDGNEEIQISFIHRHTKKTMLVVARSEELVQKSSLISVLKKRGFDVTERTAPMVIEYLRYLENENMGNIPIKKVTEVSGYYDKNTFIGRNGEIITKNGLAQDSEIVLKLKKESNGDTTVITEIDDNKAKELIKEALPRILRLNEKKVVLTVLGWFFSAPCKMPLFEVNKLKEYPILNPTGTSGSGKTTLLTVIQMLFGGGRNVDLASGATKFSLTDDLSMTNAFPYLLDEVSADRLDERIYKMILGFIIQIFNSNTSKRGRKDLTKKEYDLTAPFAVMGESSYSGSMTDASNNRSAVVVFSENWLKQHKDETEILLDELYRMDLGYFYGWYLKYVLNIIDSREFQDFYKKAELFVSKFIEGKNVHSRHTLTMKVLVFGVELIKDVLKIAGADFEITDKDIEDMLNHALGHVIDPGRRDNTLNRAMEYFSSMLIKEVTDEEMYFDTNEHKLYILRSRFLNLLERDRKTNRFDITDKSNMIRQLQENEANPEGYVLNYGLKCRAIKGNSLTCVIFDTLKLEETAKIDEGTWIHFTDADSSNIAKPINAGIKLNDGTTSTRVVRNEETRNNLLFQRIEEKVRTELERKKEKYYINPNTTSLKQAIEKEFNRMKNIEKVAISEEDLFENVLSLIEDNQKNIAISNLENTKAVTEVFSDLISEGKKIELIKRDEDILTKIEAIEAN